jgi:hypothetical protein
MFHFASNQSTEEQLRASFAPFGEIAEIVMPKNDDGKFKGFAFVQYTSVIVAGKVCGIAQWGSVAGWFHEPAVQLVRQSSFDWSKPSPFWGSPSTAIGLKGAHCGVLRRLWLP